MKRLIPLLVLIFGCQKSQPQLEPPASTFEKVPQAFSITGASIKEASGIADSKSVPGHLWVEQDSGNPPLIYLIKYDGSVADSVLLDGATNRDWEDMALGKGPDDGINYLYVGDIGDNDAKYPDYTIYRFTEPVGGVDKVTIFDKINFIYKDGAHDSEAFVVDDLSKDIYVITKRDAKSKIYKLAYPQNIGSMNEAVFVADLDYSGVVSAALSANGQEMIVKTYTQLFYYSRSQGEAVSETLKKTPKVLDYQIEVQGESVSFAVDQSGFFTLSEEAMGVVPKLNFYKRK